MRLDKYLKTARILDVKKQVSKAAAALLFEVVEETRIENRRTPGDEGDSGENS